MNKKIVGAIAAGTIVIAGVAICFGLKLQSTPDEQFATPAPASSVVQTIDETEAPATIDVNEITLDEAREIVEGAGANGQGEGESLEGEIENAPQEAPEASEETAEQEESHQSPQPGDTYVRADGSVGVITDYEKEFNDAIENISPEELQALRDLNLKFS